jgi:glycosyltransferase involved in cell wall biosynthesis
MYYQGDLKIAIVHDELTRRGGAEIVLEELLRLFPKADIYTLYAGKQPQIKIDNETKDVKTSYLQKAPLWFKRHPSRLLLALPHAAEQFDLSAYNLVISSSSAFSKAVVTRVNVMHLCYCHTPTRYLWDATHEVLKRNKSILVWPARFILHYLRIVDYAAAQRVDKFIANSVYTKKRIKSYYRRNSEVIYPPIDTTFFTPSATENEYQNKYFLCVGRLSQAKHYDQAVRVSSKLGMQLIVIGRGRDNANLRKHANNKVKFINNVTKEELRTYYRQARALIQTGVEDFGMASAESLACGTPVIALGRGGAQEIIDDGVTGVLYEDQTDEALADAIRRFTDIEKKFKRGILQSSVLKFSTHNWQEKIINKVVKDQIKT